MKSPIINPIADKNNRQSVSFKGYSSYIDEKGKKQHKFYLPFDKNRFNAELEIVHLKTDKNGEWKLDAELPDPIELYQDFNVKKQKTFSDKMLFKKSSDTAIGYRFRFHNKAENTSHTRFDPGAIAKIDINGERQTYTVIKNNRPVLDRNGLTKQVFPDICFPGYRMKDGESVFDKHERGRALAAVRNHGNKLGGNIAGIIKMLPQWSKEGYTKIVGTPFTRDDVSSHLYWTQNIYQMAPGIGSLEDFKTLQIELFKNGMNWISDGAFVNQGFQGVQFRDVLKRGEDSPFYHWFKISGLEENQKAGKLSLGVIPKNAAEHTRFRLVNVPFEIKVNDKGELKFETKSVDNGSAPSYIQIYDRRLVSPEQKQKTNELWTRYEKTNTKNAYDITGHDDVTQLVAFELNPDTFKKHVQSVYENWKKTHNSGEKFNIYNFDTMSEILEFPNFNIRTKDVGGVELWDGNADIAKLNFYVGNSDQDVIDRGVTPEEKTGIARKMIMGSFQVQDFAIQAGKYWTKITADTQFEYIANVLNEEMKGKTPTLENYKAAIQSAIESKKFPKHLENVMTDSVINNVINKTYTSQRKTRIPNAHMASYYIMANAMEFPLDTLNFAPDLSAVLSSPYITKRAYKESQLNKSRFDIYYEMELAPADMPDLDGADMPKDIRPVYEKMDKYYKKLTAEYILPLIKDLQTDLGSQPLLDDDKENPGFTEYGRYILQLIMPEIMKFAIVKSLLPNADIDISIGNGKVDYSSINLEDCGLKDLGLDGSAESAARNLISKLRSSIHFLGSNEGSRPIIGGCSGPSSQRALFIRALATRIKKLDMHSIKMAEAIQEKSESGLGWRIDAAKDIANIDALRQKDDNPYKAMKKVCDFWGKFNSEVLKINKHAYTTAEITDLGEFIESKDKGLFSNFVQAETAFVEKTGINNTANYMFFYTMLKNLFAKDVEEGIDKGIGNILELKDKLDSLQGNWKDSKGFLYQYPADSVTNSYTFIGNHDKPRPLHIFSLDMGLFLSDMKNHDHQNMARKILGDGDIDFLSVSPKAIAMGLRLKEAIEKTSCDDRTKQALKSALKDLCQGKFLGKEFEPRDEARISPAADAFGTRPFDVAISDVFKQARYSGLDIDNNTEKTAQDAMLEYILTPAMEKYKTIYKMLVTLPGSPTDFIGDKEGSTGYESKSNNIYQANRNIVNYEWITSILKNNDIAQDRNKPFVASFYKEMNEIGKLRQKPELSALCNGNTVSLPAQHGTCNNEKINVAATFRYNDKGSQVISLYTAEGANGNDYSMNHPQVDLDRIVLSSPRDREGIIGGLSEGAIFKNANSSDNSIYKVMQNNGEYYLQREDAHYHKISITEQDKNTLVLYRVK